ncbi:MAG: protein kinase domain-containing protein [Geminicoccaceae bacterium]
MTLPSYVGRYEVRDEIAAGGFAVVLKAWDEELESFVALKILHRNLADDEGIRQRFLEEARLLRRIRSPRVVTVHDVGRINDGRPYFVMDYADRGTLAPRLRSAGDSQSEPRLQIEPLLDAVADGLTSIHEVGVIHRDIKPANILFQQAKRSPYHAQDDVNGTHAERSQLVLPDERILVGDLGIAKDLAKHVTSATVMAGTPVYQSPEQADPEAEVTPATDIYAATAMVWHVLTGRPPPLPHLRDDRLKDLPEAWREAVAAGMADDPSDRYADIGTWRAAMLSALSLDSASSLSTQPTRILHTQVSCPYKGLAAYEPEDARYFYGRETLIDEMVRRVQLNRVLVIGGSSGSGKSSLLRAGLIPALRAGALPGSEGWHVALFTPGRDPLADLYVQLMRGNPETTTTVTLDQLVAHPTLARYLVEAVAKPCLLCIDQFEEVFTLTPPEQRQKFVDALSAMSDPADSKVKLVLALRADFYASCADIPWLAERISENQVLVGPMSGPELRRAVTEPARAAGLHLERGLVDAIVDEAGEEAGSLPLIAHALLETWARRERNTMSLKGFREAGGVAGAISQTADALFEQRFDPIEQNATKRLFLRLITPGEGTPDTRRLLPRSEIDRDPDPATMMRVVESLTDARLLTVDEASVQIAHEALLRTWPRLRGWIDESRDGLRMRQRISRAAADWEQESRDSDLLYRGTRLLSAVEWADRNTDQLSKLERAFLDASTETKAEAEAAAAERARRRRRFGSFAIAGLAVLAIGATVASIVAFRASHEAEENRDRAERATAEAKERFAGALGAAANGLAEVDPLLAAALGAEAVARAATSAATFDARAAMIGARRTLAGEGPFLVGSPVQVGDALAIALEGKGNLLGVGQREGPIEIFDIENRRWIPPSLKGHEGGVRDLDFGPEGRWLASAGADGSVWLWSVGSSLTGPNRQVGTFDDVVSGIAFGPGGKLIASAQGDGTIRLWDVVLGTPVGDPLARRPLGFKQVAFAPNGDGVIAGYNDGAIYGWSLPSRKSTFSPIGNLHSSNLSDLTFSPKGDYFAAARTDGSATVLAYPSGKVIGPAFSETDQIGAITFASSGDILLGGASDGTIRLWNVERQEVLHSTAKGHSQGIVDVELSGDGQLLATLGRDHQVRFWRFDVGLPLADAKSVTGRRAKGVAFSPDGEHLAAGDDTGVVQLWDLSAGETPVKLDDHRHEIWALAFSPDGNLLASGDRAGEIRLWQADQGRLIDSFEADDKAIWSIDFTADGQQLMIATASGIGLWDVESRSKKITFEITGGEVTRAALAPDGRQLAASLTTGKVLIWNIEDATMVREIVADDNAIWSVAISPDGKSMATASSDEVVVLWDFQTGQRRATFGGHKSGATDVAYLDDGATLIAVDRSGELHWWDLESARRLTEVWQGHRGASWRIAVHPDGEQFATAGDDGKVKIWDELSRARSCEIGWEAFDAVRRQQYLGTDERSVACE